jgi:hypothetical protein
VACPNSSSRFQGYQNPKIGTSRIDTPSSLKVFPTEQKIFDDFKQIMSSKLGIIWWIISKLVWNDSHYNTWTAAALPHSLAAFGSARHRFVGKGISRSECIKNH